MIAGDIRMKDFDSLRCEFLRSPRHLVKLGLFGWLVFRLAYPVAPDTPAVFMAARLAAEFIPICVVQGNNDVSSFASQSVRTRGVVYADFEMLPAQGV
jgi:hypothetical protein